MATETLGGVRPQLAIVGENQGRITQKFTNGSGAELFHGQEVFLKTDGEVDKRVDGSTVPIGLVQKGNVDGEEVIIATRFNFMVEASVETLGNAARILVPSGVQVSNLPQYDLATTTEIGFAMQLQPTTANDEQTKIGVMYDTITIP